MGGVGYRVLRFIIRALRSFARAPSVGCWRTTQGCCILAAVESRNQLDSLHPILAHLDDARLLRLKPSAHPTFPEWLAYARSIEYVPDALRLWRESKGYLRASLSRGFDDYLLAYGYYATALQVLTFVQPRVLLVANDHSLRTRTLARAAEDLGIKTAYVQHASVTAKFPPLRFDLSLLDGNDAVQKYAATGVGKGQVFLVGSAKADALRRVRVQTPLAVNRVAICVNLLDFEERVKRFVDEFTQVAPTVELVLRVHPGDRRLWERIIDIPVSRGAHEPVTDLLARVDGIVSGPSNILLDAALARLPPVFVDFAGRGSDGYGFTDRGLALEAVSAEEALSHFAAALKRASATNGALRHYSATADTAFDGRSAMLAAQVLQEFVADEVDLSRWSLVQGVPGTRTYQPLPSLRRSPSTS